MNAIHRASEFIPHMVTVLNCKDGSKQPLSQKESRNVTEDPRAQGLKSAVQTSLRDIGKVHTLLN